MSNYWAPLPQRLHITTTHVVKSQIRRPHLDRFVSLMPCELLHLLCDTNINQCKTGVRPTVGEDGQASSDEDNVGQADDGGTDRTRDRSRRAS